MSYAIDHKRIQAIHISATSDPENIKNAISQLLYFRKEVANAHRAVLAVRRFLGFKIIINQIKLQLCQNKKLK